MFAHLTPKERISFAALALLFLVVAGWIGARSMKAREPTVIQSQTPPASAPAGAPSGPDPKGEVVVDVIGCVRTPGVYKLPADSRVLDAIGLAGGFTPVADADKINLATKLTDGAQIRVPAMVDHSSTPAQPAEGPAPTAGTARGKHPTGPVDLNSATAEELRSIPGIGPSTADRILQYRDAHGGFKSVDELTAVGGIGPKKLEQMRPWLQVN